MPREVIDPVRARDLYEKYGSWHEVAAAMPRADGSHFSSFSCYYAVRHADRQHAKRASKQQCKPPSRLKTDRDGKWWRMPKGSPLRVIPDYRTDTVRMAS